MTSKPILLKEGFWFFADSIGDVDKFKVKGSNITVPALGYMFVCADNGDAQYPSGIYHTNFSLSSDSGAIAIYYNADTSNTDPSKYLLVDGIRYSSTGFGNVPDYSSSERHISYGRATNRYTPLLTKLVSPTPGAAN